MGHSHSLLYPSFLGPAPLVFCLVCPVRVELQMDYQGICLVLSLWSHRLLEAFLWAEPPWKGYKPLRTLTSGKSMGKCTEIAMHLSDLKIELKIQGFLRESVICAPVFSFLMGFLFLFRFYIKRKKKLAQSFVKSRKNVISLSSIALFKSSRQNWGCLQKILTQKKSHEKKRNWEEKHKKLKKNNSILKEVITFQGQ